MPFPICSKRHARQAGPVFYGLSPKSAAGSAEFQHVSADQRVHPYIHRLAPRCRLALSVLLLTALLPGAAAVCNADTIVLNNGRRLEGRVVDENDQAVVFEIRRIDASMRTTLPRSQIQSIERDADLGPTVCALPIFGPIGEDEYEEHFITAEVFNEALQQVRLARPDYVILVIDSPGGDVGEMEMIVDAIADAKDLHFIAHVRNAHSAAAVIAMTCPTIFMAPDASIGAAVPYQIGPDGTPVNVEEKWRSAIRAIFRHAVEVGGHSPALMRGMSEIGVELMLVHDDEGRPRVVDSTPDATGRIIKRKGQILTLTAEEALAYGLSSGTIESDDDMRVALGVESWRPTQTHLWDYVIEKPIAERRKAAPFYELARHDAQAEHAKRMRAARRQDYIDRVRPELEAIEKRLAELEQQFNAARLAEQEVLDKMQAHLQAMYDNHVKSRQQAARSNRSSWDIQRMDTQYEGRRADVIKSYEAKLNEIRRLEQVIRNEDRKLRQRIDALVSAVPPTG